MLTWELFSSSVPMTVPSTPSHPPLPSTGSPSSSSDSGLLDDPGLYLNRELSWLDFNQRVLDEASDQSVPLLERIKFLSITCSNLDEFFMVRVAGTKQQIVSGLIETGADGLLPQDALARVAQRAQRWSRISIGCGTKTCSRGFTRRESIFFRR